MNDLQYYYLFTRQKVAPHQSTHWQDQQNDPPQTVHDRALDLYATDVFAHMQITRSPDESRSALIENVNYLHHHLMQQTCYYR